MTRSRTSTRSLPGRMIDAPALVWLLVLTGLSAHAHPGPGCRADLGAGAAEQTGQAPVAVIRPVSQRGMAPFAVHVHALDSALGVGDPLSARYEWDFGDPDGQFESLVGWNASHIYERPGSYTVTLTVTDQAHREARVSIPVVVTDDTRRRLYVSNDGDDANSGRSPDAPLATFAAAMRRMHHQTALLFRRGDVFDIDEPVEIGWRNWVLGAYGRATEPPVLRWTGPVGRSAIIGFDGDHCIDAIVQDLAFDSAYHDHAGRDIVDALRPAGVNFTIRNCEFGDITTAVNCERDPIGLLTLNNRADRLHAYFVWCEGSDHCHLANRVDGSRIEHNIRLAGVKRISISHNVLTNHPKRTIWAMTGSYVYIANNELHNGRLTVGPNHAVGDPADRMEWVVVEANDVRKNDTPTSALEIEPGAEHVFLRNNIITFAGSSALAVRGRSESMRRNVADVRIVNNTAVNAAPTGSFLRCGAGATGVTVSNNLFVSCDYETGEDRSAIVFVLDHDLAGFTVISDNVWPRPARFKWVADGYHYVWPTWSDAEGYRNPDEWSRFAETTGDVYLNVALDGSFYPRAVNESTCRCQPYPGVFVDARGAPRHRDGRWTAGALEVR